jgi:tRNA G18 (ribose-2'-O)-methylase SpoU
LEVSGELIAMALLPIASIDDPRLLPYRQLKFNSDMRRAGLFVAEGDKLVQRLLNSRFRVHSVLAGEQFLAAGSLQIPPDVTVFVLKDASLRDVVGFKFHRGVLGCGYRGPTQCLEPAIDRLVGTGPEPHVSQLGTRQPRTMVVICVDVQDPTNLGTILRTAEAFGVRAVVLAGNCADPFSRRVLRVSMGATFQLPIVHSLDLTRDLVALRERCNMTLVAAVANAAGEPLEQVNPPSHLAILLGNESHGLSDEWIRMCDRQVTIPMHPQADSLNVAVATGILLYHFVNSQVSIRVVVPQTCREDW